MRRTGVAFCLVVAVAGPALASPALTTSPAQMRDAPSPYGRVVQSIPPNAEIDVRGCGEVWCSASWRDISGFVPAGAIAVGPDAPPQAPIGVAPPVVVAPFGWGYAYGWGHPWRHYY